MRAFRRAILSGGDIRRAMFLLTALTIVISMAASSLATLALHGFDLSHATTAGEVLRDTLVMSAVLPAFLCPMVVHRLLITVRDLNLARAELDKVSRTDPLTGLLNRRGFDDAIEALQKREGALRNTLAVLLCDIDHFKRVNDVHGHDCGDRALVHVAGIIRAFVGDDPLLVAARQGGEEFVVAAAGMSMGEWATRADQLRRACEDNPLVEADAVIKLTISIGTAIAIRGEESPKALLQRADEALYAAKRGGRNRVETMPAILSVAA
jgi:diguanylate cyclase (GGDEF)-like protein